MTRTIYSFVALAALVGLSSAGAVETATWLESMRELSQEIVQPGPQTLKTEVGALRDGSYGVQVALYDYETWGESNYRLELEIVLVIEHDWLPVGTNFSLEGLCWIEGDDSTMNYGFTETKSSSWAARELDEFRADFVATPHEEDGRFVLPITLDGQALRSSNIGQVSWIRELLVDSNLVLNFEGTEDGELNIWGEIAILSETNSMITYRRRVIHQASRTDEEQYTF